MPITKAIFVVAGFGTRFLPATKAQPKEMLPIVDKPIIQYLVEEAVEAGIKEVIFVTGRGKQSIENHFDTSYELESVLNKKGKNKLLKDVKDIPNMANFAYVRQPSQKGDGHALLCAAPFMEHDESVLVIFPDYLMHKSTRGIQKIIDIHNQNNFAPVVCGDIVPPDQTHLYGVMDFDSSDDNGTVKVKSFVEKPKTNAPSNLISAGYFIITPQIMAMLKNTESKHSDGEIRIADALIDYLQGGGDLYAYKPEVGGYDCGTFLGFLKATVDFGLDKEELNGEFLEFLKSKVN
jgi:UTP--glucose-1-phosphate uridylyltransferase